jgi:hypothetical protein
MLILVLQEWLKAYNRLGAPKSEKENREMRSRREKAFEMVEHLNDTERQLWDGVEEDPSEAGFVAQRHGLTYKQGPGEEPRMGLSSLSRLPAEIIGMEGTSMPQGRVSLTEINPTGQAVATLNGTTLSVVVQQAQPPTGEVWRTLKNKEEQTWFWGRALQSGNGVGAWTMDQIRGAMGEDVITGLRFQYRLSRMRKDIPPSCKDMTSEDDLFKCTPVVLKVRTNALLGQDRDGMPVSNAVAGDVGKFMETKNWELAPSTIIMEAFRDTHLAVIATQPSLNESEIDGGALATSATFAANKGHGALLWELIKRDSRRAQSDKALSASEVRQRQDFVTGMKNACREQLVTLSGEAGRTQGYVGLYCDVYLIIMARWEKRLDIERERHASGMARRVEFGGSDQGSPQPVQKDRERFKGGKVDFSPGPRQDPMPVVPSNKPWATRVPEIDEIPHKGQSSGHLSQQQIDAEVARLPPPRRGSCERGLSDCVQWNCHQHLRAGAHPDVNARAYRKGGGVTFAEHRVANNLRDDPLMLGIRGDAARTPYRVTQGQLDGYRRSLQHSQQSNAPPRRGYESRGTRYEPTRHDSHPDHPGEGARDRGRDGGRFQQGGRPPFRGRDGGRGRDGNTAPQGRDDRRPGDDLSNCDCRPPLEWCMPCSSVSMPSDKRPP